LGKFGTSSFYVCGQDHADKCYLWSSPTTIVIGRPGYTNNPSMKKAIFIPHATAENDVSSTQIRKALSEGTLEKVRELMHPSVYAILEAEGKGILNK